MFFSCQWQGEDCVSSSYSALQTDMGRCVSFHTGSGGAFTSKTGSGFGMSLTLNIEQYEYIRGPSTDAGIKVGFFIKSRSTSSITGPCKYRTSDHLNGSMLLIKLSKRGTTFVVWGISHVISEHIEERAYTFKKPPNMSRSPCIIQWDIRLLETSKLQNFITECGSPPGVNDGWHTELHC